MHKTPKHVRHCTVLTVFVCYLSLLFAPAYHDQTAFESVNNAELKHTFRFNSCYQLLFGSLFMFCFKTYSPQSPPLHNNPFDRGTPFASQINMKIQYRCRCWMWPCIRFHKEHIDSTERKQILFGSTNQKAFSLPLFHSMSLSFFLTTHHLVVLWKKINTKRATAWLYRKTELNLRRKKEKETHQIKNRHEIGCSSHAQCSLCTIIQRTWSKLKQTKKKKTI